MHSHDSRDLKEGERDTRWVHLIILHLILISWQIRIQYYMTDKTHPPVVDGVGLFERRRHAVVEEQVPVLGDLPVLPDEGKLSWVIRICSEKFPLTGG